MIKHIKSMMLGFIVVTMCAPSFAFRIENKTRKVLTVHLIVNSKVPVTLNNGRVMYNMKSDIIDTQTVKPGQAVHVALDLTNDQNWISVQESNQGSIVIQNQYDSGNSGPRQWVALPNGSLRVDYPCTFDGQDPYCSII